MKPYFSVVRVLAFVVGGYVVPAAIGRWIVQAMAPLLAAGLLGVQGGADAAGMVNAATAGAATPAAGAAANAASVGASASAGLLSYVLGACPYVLVFLVSVALLRPCFGVTLSWFIAGPHKIRPVWLFGGFAGYLLLATLAGFTVQTIGGMNVIFDALGNIPLGLALLGPIIVIFQTASEELFFRCLLIRWLFPARNAGQRGEVGAWCGESGEAGESDKAGLLPSGKAMLPALVLTAVVFALFHLIEWILAGNPDIVYAAIRYAAMGVFLAWLACFTGSFELSFAVHAAHNMAALAFGLGAASSIAIDPMLQTIALLALLGISAAAVWFLKSRRILAH